ncbi:MAG: IS1595 family transposase [Acetobacteraceae bacterium]
MSVLCRPEFTDETKAREWLETELWPNGPVCPHCGVMNEATLMRGKSHRPGLYQCNACREPFSVTVGTLYERSKVPLNKWLAATHLMMASKKGMSALEIGRLLGLSKKTAWFLCHRIRESLRETKATMPLGGKNKVVEADETYVGGKEGNKHKSKRTPGRQGGGGKEAVVALVEREGRVRSHHVPAVTAKTLGSVLHAHIDHKSYLMTDESTVYLPIGETFSGHGTVNHSIEEYVRGSFWHTNTVEGYFSIFKRGVYGTFHHVSQQHLKRYLAEFDYRYNERSALGVTDAQRMAKSVQGIVGKRLTYRRPRGEAEGQEALTR